MLNEVKSSLQPSRIYCRALPSANTTPDSSIQRFPLPFEGDFHLWISQACARAQKLIGELMLLTKTILSRLVLARIFHLSACLVPGYFSDRALSSRQWGK